MLWWCPRPTRRGENPRRRGLTFNASPPPHVVFAVNESRARQRKFSSLICRAEACAVACRSFQALANFGLLRGRGRPREVIMHRIIAWHNLCPAVHETTKQMAHDHHREGLEYHPSSFVCPILCSYFGFPWPCVMSQQGCTEQTLSISIAIITPRRPDT